MSLLSHLNQLSFAKLSKILTSAFFALVMLVLFSSHSFAQQIDRTKLAERVLLATPNILTYLGRDSAFQRQLDPQELEQLQKLLDLFRENRLRAASDFPGGSVFELVRRFGLSVEFSDRSADFVLNPQEPARTAKTTEIWTDPVVFNNTILSDPKVEMNVLQLVQLCVHELGHKLGAQKNQVAVDRLSAKVSNFLQRFYSSDSSGPLSVEALSLPTENARLKFGNESIIDWPKLSTDLIFLGNRSEGVFPLSQSWSALQLAAKLSDISTLSKASGNVVERIQTRVAQVNFSKDEFNNEYLNFEIESRYRRGMLGLVNAFVDDFFDLLPPESKSFRLGASFRLGGKISDLQLNYQGIRVLPPLKGFLTDSIVEVKQTSPNQFEFTVKTDAHPDLEVLKLAVRQIELHLKPSAQRTEDGKRVLVYHWQVPPETVAGDFRVEGLADVRGLQFKEFVDKKVFKAGDKPPFSVVRLQPPEHLFYNVGKGWQQFTAERVHQLDSLAPGIAVSLSTDIPLHEVRIVWKKGIVMVTPSGQALGLVAGFESEVFRPGEFILERTGNTSLLIVKSRAMATPLDIQTAHPEKVIALDGGRREIQEIVLIGSDLSSTSKIQLPYTNFYDQHGFQAHPMMIEEVRKKLAPSVRSCQRVHL